MCTHPETYYSLESDNFYCVKCKKGMGEKYYHDQRQDSTTDQMNDLWRMAIKHGMYDAADWIKNKFPIL